MMSSSTDNRAIAALHERRAWLADALAERRSAPTRFVFPVPVCPPASFLRARLDPVVVFDPPGPVRLAGAGAYDACELRPEAPVRFRTVVHPQSDPSPVRYLGGRAFSADSARAEPWTEFGASRFLLPRWSYEQRGERASLTLTVSSTPSSDALLAELDQLFDVMRADPRVPLSDEPSARAPWNSLEGGEDLFRSGVSAALRDMERTDLRKVVLARRLLLDHRTPADTAPMLSRLAERDPLTTRFALRLGHATWLGASPERLVVKNGAHVLADALAGTLPASSPIDDASQVDAKLRYEHKLVPEAILRRLAPICRFVDRPAAPELLHLHDVTHLRSVVEGELAQDRHVLDLVDLLHPTPAVGGVPRDLALEWISRNEPVARGWYAGPFGWYDEHGDGAFVVALRSGLFVGRQAHLYAGAGLVAGSQVDAELEETSAKLEPLRAVLQ